MLKKKRDKSPSKEELIAKYKDRFPTLKLQEEYEKFELYNRDVRCTKLKSIELGWLNWLKNAVVYQSQSVDVIRRREVEATIKKQNEIENELNRKKLTPEEYQEKRKKLIKQMSI